jgi:hypothetical protein
LTWLLVVVVTLFALARTKFLVGNCETWVPMGPH